MTERSLMVINSAEVPLFCDVLHFVVRWCEDRQLEVVVRNVPEGYEIIAKPQPVIEWANELGNELAMPKENKLEPWEEAARILTGRHQIVAQWNILLEQTIRTACLEYAAQQTKELADTRAEAERLKVALLAAKPFVRLSSPVLAQIEQALESAGPPPKTTVTTWNDCSSTDE